MKLGLLQKIRIAYYKHILSNYKIKPCIINSPTLFYSLDGKNIDIDPDVSLGVFPSPYFYNSYNHLDIRYKASIRIKSKSVINNNFCIIAQKADITIGKNCLIGTNFKAFSSDFHALSIKDRDDENKIKSESIDIGDFCFIGNDVTILKGVSLGRGCVVGSSSVLTKSFEANSLICGNPARKIRRIDENEI